MEKITYTWLTQVTETLPFRSVANDLVKLINELSPELKWAPGFDELGDALRRTRREHDVLVAICGQRVVGMGMVALVSHLHRLEARFDDIVVLEEFRGRGIGKRIVQMLIAEAKRKGAADIELASRHHRVAAGKLYEQLGFKRRRTRVYELELK